MKIAAYSKTISLFIIFTFILTNTAYPSSSQSQKTLRPAMQSDKDMVKGAIEAANTKESPKSWTEGEFNTQDVPNAEIADIRLNERAASAFEGGRVVEGLIGLGSKEAHFVKLAEEYRYKNPATRFSVDEITEKLRTARGFLEEVWDDDEFLVELTHTIIKTGALMNLGKLDDYIVTLNDLVREAAVLKGREVEKMRRIQYQRAKSRGIFLHALKNMVTKHAIKSELATAARLRYNNTRFVAFLFEENGVWDPYLFKKDGGIVLHMGTYPFEGSEDLVEGAKTMYMTLGRILGYAEYPDRKEAVKTFRALITHEFKDFARGEHENEDETTTALINKINGVIKSRYDIDNIGMRISERDEDFYNHIIADDISSEIDKYGLLIPFKDVVENLAGFRSQISKLGNLPIVVVTKHEGTEREEINRLKEYGILPKNVTTMRPPYVVNQKLLELEGRRIIALGFKESFREYGMKREILLGNLGNIIDFEVLRVVQFKDLSKNELLNWDRISALLGVFMGEEKVLEKTNLDDVSPLEGSSATTLAAMFTGSDIYNVQVGVPVTKRLLEDARRTYEDLKTNI